MSRYIRFAVCAVLGFGVVALFLSDTGNDAPPKMEQIIAHVDAQLAAEEAKTEVKVVYPPKPRLSEQARKARDKSALERELRSAQKMAEEPPATDKVTVRPKP